MVKSLCMAESKSTLPPDEIGSDEAQLKLIDSFITNRYIGGKFSGQVIIHGEKLTEADFNIHKTLDFKVLPYIGPKGCMPYHLMLKIDPTNRMKGFYTTCYEDARRDLDGDFTSEFRCTPSEFKFADSLNITYLQDSTNENITHVLCHVPVSDMDASYRRHYFSNLFCDIPTDQFQQLIKLIEKNPDNAERFIETTFAGIDNSTSRNSVNRVSIIDINTYIPLSIFSEKSIQDSVQRGFIDQVLRKAMKNKLLNLQGVTTHNFSHPMP